MEAILVQFAVAAAVVIVAGSMLARAAEHLAEVTGYGRLLVGSILLAGATSLPELAVDVSAVRAGLDDVAVGDLLGSSLFNLLILAIADLCHARRGAMLTPLSRDHALSGMLAVLLPAVAGLLILLRIDAHASWSWGGIGFGSVAIAGCYLLGVRLVFRDQQVRAAARPTSGSSSAPRTPANRPMLAPIARFAAATAAIFVAAPFVAEAAGDLAEISGLGETFVGTTLVAASTSLPELVATIVAVRIGSFDLAVGNVFGSNAFNMAMILPIDLFSEGPLLASISPAHATTAFWVVATTSVTIMSLLYEQPGRRRLLDPGAGLVIALVALALLSLRWTGSAAT